MVGAPAFVVFGIELLEASGDGAQFGLRGADVHAGLEAADDRSSCDYHERRAFRRSRLVGIHILAQLGNLKSGGMTPTTR